MYPLRDELVPVTRGGDVAPPSLLVWSLNSPVLGGLDSEPEIIREPVFE